MSGTGHVGMVGHAPKVKIQPASQTISTETVRELTGITKEKEKYLKAWSVDDYRKVSPGERCVDMFLDAVKDVTKEYEGEMLIDFGCGTGRAAKKLDDVFHVTPMDFACNALDEDVAEHFGDRFVEHDLTQKTPLHADWGYCCDVMEHLPPESIDQVLETIFLAADNVFFQIATIPDHFGGHPDIKEQLHLTVWDYDRWLKKFAEHGCVVHRSKEMQNHVIFFVSGYQGFAFNKMKMNTTPDVLWEQMRENFSKGFKQLAPFKEQPEQKVVLLAGGPSLNNYIDEIKQHKANGAKIVTMNGTYAWAKEHDLWPVTQFMIDAREFNNRFVDPVDEQNLFVIASQCHPSVLDKLPVDRTYLMQCNLDQGSIQICNEVLGEIYDYDGWFPVPGGSSVLLRTLPALQMLGFRDVEVYGADSCLMGHDVPDKVSDPTKHHAYEQPENDIPAEHEDRVAYATINGKTFAVEPWMLCQAKEFVDFRHSLTREMDIKVHGEGLIAHCLATGVDIFEEDS